MGLLFPNSNTDIPKQLTNDEQKLYDTFQTPIDDFVGNSQQEYLERYNYFQDILDIVEDLQINGGDIEKIYHAIVAIGEIQDYFKNQKIQEKLNLLLDEIILNLEKLKQSKRPINENEERLLDHIKRFINKRGLKKSVFKIKFQEIHKLATKIVNNTRIIENKSTYKHKIKFEDLFGIYNKQEIKNILESIRSIQLTKGCSGHCSRCYANALNRTHIGTYLSWNTITKIIDGLEGERHIFYFASDPLDWYDKDAGKDYTDINKYYFDKFGKYPNITTKIPNNQYSIEAFKKLWNITGLNIRVSVTKNNIDLIKEILGSFKLNWYDFKDRIIAVNTKKGVSNETVMEFLSKSYPNITSDLSYNYGKAFSYNDNTKLHNMNSKYDNVVVSPDGLYRFVKSAVSSFYPEGYKIKSVLDLDKNEITFYKLYELVVNNNRGQKDIQFYLQSQMYLPIFKTYLKNNPSHKLFFKKKFEKLIKKELFKNLPELFELFGLK